jgi:GNAT superfamily N-acetyltransferase
MTILRPPRSDELPLLSELCLRSKASWGYDAAFMAACRAELMLCPEELRTTHLQLAEETAGPLGLAQVAIEEGRADLLKLFVEPARQKGGIGRLLMAWALATARALGASEMVIEADPGAVGFYRRFGASQAGWAPSGSIPGRRLPRLVLDLAQQKENPRFQP